jgi:hypothetical protein
MITTSRTFPVPPAKLIPWEGYYIYRDGRKVKVYFDLLPNQQVDTEQFYEVYELIGTTGSKEMTVLGKNIIEPKTAMTHLPRGY